jgi:hypothetical protein
MKSRKCSICGKEFIPAAMHMYKTKKKGEITKIQCSYTCYRKAGGDNGRPNRDAKTGKYKKK